LRAASSFLSGTRLTLTLLVRVAVFLAGVFELDCLVFVGDGCFLAVVLLILSLRFAFLRARLVLSVAKI
jgi:hypothetical protein